MLEQLGIGHLEDVYSHWMGHVFVVIFLTLLLNFILKQVLKRLVAKSAQTHNLWDDALLSAVQPPLSLLLWILGISIAAHLIQYEENEPALALIASARDFGVIVCLGWFLFRLAHNVETRLIAINLERDPNYDKTTAVAIGKLVRLSLLITIALIGLQTMGISISGVLAFGGIGGIAVGFAARDLLANFFGGLMIYLDRPFSVGDWIRSDDRNIEGTVEEIGWRLTRVRTFDKRPLYIPNAVFANIVVENPSRMQNRRIKETIGLRYQDIDKVAIIVEEVRSLLKNDPDIDTDKTLMVNFNAFNASSLDFFIYTFTKTTDWSTFHQVKEKILLAVAEVIERHGAEIAFPTKTLHIADRICLDSKEETSS